MIFVVVVFREGHTMFKSLIEKHHGKSWIGLEEETEVEVFLLEWATTDKT